ncbi:ABC transporter permease [Ammoniphilus sp. YIM 78166]|uniref:ABC transporter permease n=1 Tax=Ammoniphilus sp. YIM 78166 TaxID=1644106 RepID=UPI00106F8648|nr:ABC transporter permease subunit [Ammoniphilus sp. YIM 78166]
METFRRHSILMASATVLVLFTAVAIFAPLLAPNDPNFVDLTQKLQPSSKDFPIGTDHLGRCQLSRLLFGARTSLSTAFIVMSITFCISVPIGVFAGYMGGIIDAWFIRICDMLMAFPNFLLSLAFVGMLGGPSYGHLILAMVCVQWVFYARFVRGMVLSVKERSFVMAARICGTSPLKIAIKHIIPTILASVIVLLFMDIGGVILSISGLSFLGLGVQPPYAEWGMMINDSKPYFRSHPMLMMYPGVIIFLVVIAFNLFGESLRQWLQVERRY